ncbi:APH(3') family aminoglycoside O-phosphotransferase [Salininema proteolyticum]|uniref:APH(3') family aminoglycoside O-phosphotransferase n=1 Tax=Salininema proteolyticum TaxID=1607685 RepID=A0ABV8U4M4_9ACTN
MPLETLRRRYAAYEWRPVAIGMSDARVFHLASPTGRDLFVKTAALNEHPDPGFHLHQEAERLEWLAGQDVPAPEVVDAGRTGEGEYLVMTAVSGRSLAEPWSPAERRGLMEFLGEFTARLHGLPVSDCPFSRGVKEMAAAARKAADLELVDLDDLDEERDGADLQELSGELEDALDSAPPEEAVVCHGDYCAPNVLADPATLAISGIVDVGRVGVADRYSDLALMTRSLSDRGLNPQWGTWAAHAFMEAYGIDPARIDEEKIAFYRLLDEFA